MLSIYLFASSSECSPFFPLLTASHLITSFYLSIWFASPQREVLNANQNGLSTNPSLSTNHPNFMILILTQCKPLFSSLIPSSTSPKPRYTPTTTTTILHLPPPPIPSPQLPFPPRSSLPLPLSIRPPKALLTLRV